MADEKAHDPPGIRTIAVRRLAYNAVFDSTQPTARLGGTQGTRHPVLQKPSSPRPQGLRCPEAEPATSNGRGLFLWVRGRGARPIQRLTAPIYSNTRGPAPRPLWAADIPQKAGSTRRNGRLPMAACASSTPSPRSRFRRHGTRRRAGCRPLRACRACTPRRRQHGGDCCGRWGSTGRQPMGLQRAAHARRCQAFNARPGPSAGCPDRSRQSPPRRAPSIASAALSTRPTPSARGRIGPRGATVAAAAGRSAMSTVRRS